MTSQTRALAKMERGEGDWKNSPMKDDKTSAAKPEIPYLNGKVGFGDAQSVIHQH